MAIDDSFTDVLPAVGDVPPLTGTGKIPGMVHVVVVAGQRQVVLDTFV